jgi:hypothetical protein
VIDLTAANERDAVWHWARAEISSPRFGYLYRPPRLTPSIAAALEGGDAASLSDAQWAQLQDAVFAVRAPILAGLKRLGIAWYGGKVSASDLAGLRVMNLPQFRIASPSLRLGELVQALERGDYLPDPDFVHNYWDLRDSFDPTNLRAAPILIAMNAEGPYGILEGYSRLAVLLSRLTQGSTLPDTPVVVGVCARIPEWVLNDHPEAPLYWD